MRWRGSLDRRKNPSTIHSAVNGPPPRQMPGRMRTPLTQTLQSPIHHGVTSGWHPCGDKGRRAVSPLLLACDEAGELEFGPTERKAVLASHVPS